MAQATRELVVVITHGMDDERSSIAFTIANGGLTAGLQVSIFLTSAAVDLVRKASEVLGGKGGGGRPDMAQAGGPDGSKADAALKAIEAALGAH